MEAVLALPEQAIGGIDAYPEARAAEMMLGHFLKLRDEQLQGRAVAGGFHVTIERVEEPERRIGGVVEAVALALGKEIRDQAIADVMTEGAKDPRRFEMPAGGERQAFEADHRVAAPVGEPMVARDDGAHFIAGGAGSRGVLDPACGGDDELIRGEHQFGRRPGPDTRRSGGDETLPTRQIGGERGLGIERENGWPFLGGRHERHGTIGPQLDREEAGTPEPPARVVAAICLGLIDDLIHAPAVVGKVRAFIMHMEPERMGPLGGGNFKTPIANEQ